MNAGEDLRTYADRAADRIRNKDKRKAAQERVRAHLAEADPAGWRQYCAHHWWRIVDRDRLEYWPGSQQWKYRNVMHKGGLYSMHRFFGFKIGPDDLAGMAARRDAAATPHPTEEKLS